MTEKEVKEIFNATYSEYIDEIAETARLSEMAIISKFEKMFFKKLKEKKIKKRGNKNGN